jgi:hypothetical protein
LFEIEHFCEFRGCVAFSAVEIFLCQVKNELFWFYVSQFWYDVRVITENLYVGDVRSAYHVWVCEQIWVGQLGQEVVVDTALNKQATKQSRPKRARKLIPDLSR